MELQTSILTVDAEPTVRGPALLNLPPLLESANSTMARAIATARQVAAFNVPILIMGETGSGKHVFANAIHEWSRRRDGPFITVSCGAPDERQRERPGRRAGASPHAWQDTYARLRAADHGTLFFEEVAMLPNALQSKLTRFLDGHPVERGSGSETVGPDARVIAATDRDLELDVRAGRFRQDLFFRLNVVGVCLPPLRERPEDLPKLADHILANLCVRHRRASLHLSQEAHQALTAYGWPGNVRELVAAMERATVLSRDDTIRTQDLPDRIIGT